MSMAPLVLSGHLKDLGGGFTVRRLLPAVQRKSVGPFLFLTTLAPLPCSPRTNTTCGRTRTSAWPP